MRLYYPSQHDNWTEGHRFLCKYRFRAKTLVDERRNIVRKELEEIHDGKAGKDKKKTSTEPKRKKTSL